MCSRALTSLASRAAQRKALVAGFGKIGAHDDIGKKFPAGGAGTADDDHRAAGTLGHLLHGAAHHAAIAGGPDVFVPGVGAHDDQVHVFGAGFSQDFPVGNTDDRFQCGVIAVFEKIGVGMLHLLLHPVHVVRVDLLGLLLSGRR